MRRERSSASLLVLAHNERFDYFTSRNTGAGSPSWLISMYYRTVQGLLQVTSHVMSGADQKRGGKSSGIVERVSVVTDAKRSKIEGIPQANSR